MFQHKTLNVFRLLFGTALFAISAAAIQLHGKFNDQLDLNSPAYLRMNYDGVLCRSVGLVALILCIIFWRLSYLNRSSKEWSPFFTLMAVTAAFIGAFLLWPWTDPTGNSQLFGEGALVIMGIIMMFSSILRSYQRPKESGTNAGW